MASNKKLVNKNAIKLKKGTPTTYPWIFNHVYLCLKHTFQRCDRKCLGPICKSAFNFTETRTKKFAPDKKARIFK